MSEPMPSTAGLSEAAVLEALATVQDPELKKDLVSLGMVRDVRVDGADVSVTIVLTTPACPMRARIEADCMAALQALPGVDSVHVEFAAAVPRDRRLAEKMEIDVRNIVAVGSGKGGVGKSTVSVNLACSLARSGSSVGILDADVYGPNIPMMMGVEGVRPEQGVGRGIQPVVAHGVRLMSIGFLVDADTPLVWRGPLLHTTVRQFLSDVEWGPLDYLIVDLPPGTGDVALSLAQSVPLTGAVVVTTPQAVSMADVIKSVAMFQLPQLDVEVLGVIENMSGFVAPDTGQRYDIFGRGGGTVVAERMGVPFLGEIPIDPDIRESGDFGTPIVVGQPESAVARAFGEIAGRLAAAVSVRNLSRDASAPYEADRDLPLTD